MLNSVILYAKIIIKVTDIFAECSADKVLENILEFLESLITISV